MRTLLAVLMMLTLSNCAVNNVPMLPPVAQDATPLEVVRAMDNAISDYKDYDRLEWAEECSEPPVLEDLYNDGVLVMCEGKPTQICTDIITEGNLLGKALIYGSGSIIFGCAIIDDANGCNPSFAHVYYQGPELLRHELSHIKGLPDEFYGGLSWEIEYDPTKYWNKDCKVIKLYGDY